MKKNWSIKVRCVVIKQLHLSECTEEQASNNPWDFVDEELEADQTDWQVLDVEEDK